MPVSYYQKPFWLDWQLNPKSFKYNTALIYQLNGKLDIEAITKTLDALVNEYHIGCKQLKERDLVVENIHSATLENHALKKDFIKEDLISNFIDQIFSKPFDLKETSLYQFNLLKIQEEYVLILNFSHLITDGFTGSFVAKQVRDLYHHYAHLEPKPIIPAYSSSYEAYICKQESEYLSEQKPLDILYWKKKLDKKTLKLQLPFAHNSQGIQDLIKNHNFSLEKKTLLAIKKLAKAESTTLFVVISALYAAVLYRYTHQKQFCFSYSIDTRPVGFKDTPGCFVNTVPWIVSVDKSYTFREWIRYFTQQRKEAKKHQRCSLVEILQILKKLGKIESGDYFNIGMGEVYLCQEPLLLKNIIDKPLSPPKKEGFYDLFLGYQVVSSLELETKTTIEEDLQFRFEYKESVFDEFYIKQLADHFQTVLNQCLLNVDEKIDKISLLSESEKEEILYCHPRESGDPVKNAFKTLDQYFEEQAQKTPYKVAVSEVEAATLRINLLSTASTMALTFEALNRKANQLAHKLQFIFKNSLKNKSNYLGNTKFCHCVAICMDRRVEVVIAMLGVLKAGAYYLPIDPDEAPHRIQTMLLDAKPDVLLTLDSNLKKSPILKTAPIVIRLDKDWNSISNFPYVNVDLSEDIYNARNLAYIIYTSGTTGIPKGVMVEHRSVINTIMDIKERCGVSQDDKILNTTSIAFDVYGSELYLALFSGAELVLCDKKIVKNPQKLSTVIHNVQPTIIHATPTLCKMLLNYLTKPKIPFAIFSSGESLSKDLAQKLQKYSNKIWNFYGPTETTIYSTIENVREDEEAISIGRGLANTDLYVLDEFLNPVPIGVVGELYIGGLGLARGYLNDQALTDQKFISNPFIKNNANGIQENENNKMDKNKEKLYKTGDYVRWRMDGKLEYMGRKDSQIKIRGHRLELGEIEAVLCSHPMIEMGVIIIEEEHLVSYFVLKKIPFFKKIFKDMPEPVNSKTLKLYFEKRLPHYMQPAVFIPISKLPLTLTGKIDKAQLPRFESIDSLNHIRVDNIIRPFDRMELSIKEIWINILKANDKKYNISVTDDFFHVGGHSLAAVFLVTKINEQFNVQYPVAWVYEYKTIREQSMQMLLASNASIGPATFYHPIIQYNVRNDEKERIPLFFVHPALSGAEVYESLAEHLSQLCENTLFYGIDSYNLNSGQPWLTSIEALADYYINAIRSVKPKGPYVLGGWSFGGIVALEMARKLVEQGEVIPKVYLLDSFVFNQNNMKSFFEAMNSEELLEAIPESWNRYLTTLPPSYLEKVFQCFKNDVQMLTQYSPKPYKGSVLLIKSTRFKKLSRWFPRYLKGGWKSLIENLEVEPIHADHFNIIEGDRIKTVAKIIKRHQHWIS